MSGVHETSFCPAGFFARPAGMIVTDLDRSLLTDDKTISELSRAVLEKCREKNYLIAFATARPVRSVEAYVDMIKPDAVVYHNGALVSAGGRVLGRYRITPAETRETLARIESAFNERRFPEITVSVEINDVLYTNFEPDNTISWTYKKIDFRDLPEHDADKIIMGGVPAAEMKALEKVIPGRLYVQIDSGRFGFIQNRLATKWLGVKALAAHFGIDIAKTIAFGDDLNDKDMIQNCGIGVAMENALDEVKAAADFVCAANGEDGVARWLAEHVLGPSADL